MTGIQRVTDRFEANRAQRHASLLPYLSAGFPDDSIVRDLIVRFDGLGAAAVELGFPFSDSVADGPVIQSSFHATLAHGFTSDRYFEFVASVRSRVRCGLLAMVSYSIVSRMGVDRFVRRAAESGMDGLIVPDLPVEEASELSAALKVAQLCHVGLVAPATSPQRRVRIAEQATGFLYQIAAAGTTGERVALPMSLASDMSALRALSGLPICAGFGISTPDQVREVCRICDGAIVGSSIVRRLTEMAGAGRSHDTIVNEVSQFMGQLIAAAVK